MADYYAFLNKNQDFGSSFTRYTGISTFQSDYIRKPIMDQRRSHNMPYIPLGGYPKPYVRS